MGQQLREILFQIELIKRKRVQEFLLGIGLTPGQGQARILVFVDAHPAVTQKEIADACMLDVTTMSRSLDRLEEEGLLRREKNPDCRRSYQVCLTPAGEKKAREVQAVLRQMDEIICEGISEQEHEEFLRILRKICGNMERSIE